MATGMKEKLAQRRANFEAFEAWEAQVGSVPTPQDVFARIGYLNSLLPLDARVSILDPEYEGVQTMHRCLALLGANS